MCKFQVNVEVSQEFGEIVQTRGIMNRGPL